MVTSLTTRRMVRSLAQRAQVRTFAAQVDWSKKMWTSSPQAAAHYNAIKSWVSMADSAAETYKSPPGPVDFTSVKSKVRDQELVKILEEFYKANKPPPTVHEWPEEDQKQTEYHLQFLKELDAFHKEALPVLEKELEFQMANRTTTETTMFDMKVNYPAIHEEIEDEIERREWFKDTPYDKSKGSSS